MSRMPLPSRIKIDDQVFRVVGTVDHWTRNDRYLELLLYEAVCAHPGCKRRFRYKATKTNFRRHHVNRRCEQHKAPGVPVPVKKRRSKRRTQPKAPAPQLQQSAEMRRLLLENARSIKRYGRPSWLD